MFFFLSLFLTVSQNLPSMLSSGNGLSYRRHWAAAKKLNAAAKVSGAVPVVGDRHEAL